MRKVTTLFCAALTTLAAIPVTAGAAIALDRTRVIYNEGDKAVPLTVTNEHLSKPYLAQSGLRTAPDRKSHHRYLSLRRCSGLSLTAKARLKCSSLRKPPHYRLTANRSFI